MSGYLLDTNVISEVRKPKPHGGVVAWLQSIPENQVFISAFTLGELQRGVEAARRNDPSKAHEIEIWIDQIASCHSIISMDSSCFREWARLLRGQSNDIFGDLMLAATARVYQLTIATRNERDFASVDVQLFNPFQPGK